MVPIPEPEPGLVISYAYLWHSEASRGRDEGSKYRPVVVVLATQDKPDGGKAVLVAPITHRPPDDPAMAVEIPPQTKRRLGLDADRSWIVVSEVNRFEWPGPDLRPVSPGCWVFGLLPAGLFRTVRARMVELVGRRRARQVYRSP